ncbi:MAG TPA: hypothetical protein VFI91_07190, partial [Longimicrobiaceae bacterium]|nr:hypothetical protein [Longimicrobiaceae bacterium]
MSFYRSLVQTGVVFAAVLMAGCLDTVAGPNHPVEEPIELTIAPEVSSSVWRARDHDLKYGQAFSVDSFGISITMLPNFGKVDQSNGLAAKGTQDLKIRASFTGETF